MKTNKFREKMEAEFGKPWVEINALIREAKYPYPAKLTWKCIAKGRARDGQKCILAYALDEDPNVTGRYVVEQFTYIRFAGSEIIWRYQNSAEMKEELLYFDRFKETKDWTDGTEVILEPVGLARSREYSIARREAIKNGTHIVKKRGENFNERVVRVHEHFRPY